MPPNWLTNDGSNKGKGDPQLTKDTRTEEKPSSYKTVH